MKKFILAAVAASLVTIPAMAAPIDQRHPVKVIVKKQPAKRVVVKQVRRGPAVQYRSFRKGQRFDQRYARNYRPVSNWQQYRGRHLYAPPRGYHWVQSGNDAVLVAIAGGLIGAVVAGAFN